MKNTLSIPPPRLCQRTTQPTNWLTKQSTTQTMQIDNANDANDDANNKPADDYNKSEHDDDEEESDKNAMPKKEEDESEDESDDESKLPKDQSAVLRDSGLGSSSVSLSVGTGASVSTLVVHPHIKHDTSLPLPT